MTNHLAMTILTKLFIPYKIWSSEHLWLLIEKMHPLVKAFVW
jgi:hypothetical protein